MKTITMRRRMVSLTLAASVALPQASSVFAASLWNEDGVDHRVAQAIESGQPEIKETVMPWVTLPVDDKLDQSIPEETQKVTGEIQALPSTVVPTEPDDVPTPPEALEETVSPPPSLPAENDTPSPVPSEVTTPDDKGGSSEEEGTVSPPAVPNEGETTSVSTSEAPSEEPIPTEVIPPEEEPQGPDLSTGEPVGGEELDQQPNETETVLSTMTNSASLAIPTSSELGPLTQWMYYRLGYGVKVNDSGSKALTDLNNHFAVESTEGGKEQIIEDASGNILGALPAVEYGYRDYGQYLTNDPWGENSYSLCIFPSEKELGRVPDMQFEGWYVYPSGVKAEQTAKEAQGWVYGDVVGGQYDESAMTRVDTYLYEPSDPYYGDPYLNGEDIRYQNNSSLASLGLAQPLTLGDLGKYWDGGRDYGYGYRYLRDESGNIKTEMNPETGDISIVEGNGYTDPVSFVGRWVDSDESRAGSLSAFVNGEELPLYADETYTDTVSEETFRNGQNGGKYEYWLRVQADVDSISLDLSTLELYYSDYSYTGDQKQYENYFLDTAKSHVKVTAAFGSETTSYTDGLSAQMLPKWSVGKDGFTITPQNSLEDPAHSEWSLSGISLRNAADGNLYNDITVEITSPSGNVTTTYTFHVQRLTEPTLTRAWGNTPVGMIRRDTNNLSSTDAANRAETEFKEIYKFNPDPRMYPNGSENQNGTIFRETYSPKAWVDSVGNVDIDPTAIVVYQDSVFRDPGIALTGAMGEAVNIPAGGVSRSLRLKSADVLLAGQIGKTDTGKDCWYTTDGLVDTETFEAISLIDGSDVIDLRGRNILPGVYTLEYRYTDPISGKVYGSDKDNYVTENGKAAAPSFRRTLVVLPAPGDVDMDGAVTMADALTLQAMMSNDALGNVYLNGVRVANESGEVVTTDSALALFAYRVCDVNHDGILDDKDVQLLRALPNPKLVSESNASNSDYYYLPLPTGESGEHYARQPFAVETTDVPKVEMIYLGKEGGKSWSSESGFMTGITGPWESNADAGVELGDIFWLGVRLNRTDIGDLNLEAVKSLTFTLAYDARYVTPAVVLDQTNWEAAGVGDDAQLTQERWKIMMSLYNLSGEASGHTVWGDSQFGYRFTEAAGTGKRFTTHYSTAVLPLENSLGATEVRSRLQSITFSVELDSNQSPVLLQDTQGEYLFVVPFQMTRHPFGQEKVQLVEFEAGMRSFTLTGYTGTTYAYSSHKIFGSATQNLKSQLPYGNAGAEIPLGEDKTEVFTIYNFNHDGEVGDSKSKINGVYAEGFYSGGGWTANGTYQRFTMGGELQGKLPRGLEYHIDNSYIDGIPEEAGTFEFYIGSTPYRMVIDKAPLHFWAENQSSYYGQSEFRGDAYSGFTFQYAPGDIRSFEWDRANASEGSIKVDGRGVGLEALLNDPDYTASKPTFTAVTEVDGPAVSNDTPVGTYGIINPLTPKSKNYEFIYSPEMAAGTVGLTILPRPVQVLHLNGSEENKTVVASVFSDQPGTKGGLKAWQGGTGIPEDAVFYTIGLPDPTYSDSPGFYHGLPLTQNGQYVDGVILPKDSLEITYSVDYIRTQADIDRFGEFNGGFDLGGEQEGFRTVQIRDLKLTGGTRSENYVLVSDAARLPAVENAVVGKVILRRTLQLQLVQLPPLEYQYGDVFSRSNELHYYIEMDGGLLNGQYVYSDTSIVERGITAYWASAEEKEAYEGGFEFDYENNGSRDKWAIKTGQTFTTEYNGRYLCLSTPSVDEEGNSIVIRRYAEAPLSVRPRDIVLTAVKSHRYYGEENGTLAFTYQPNQLAAKDYRSGLTGAGEELRTILGGDNYKQPTLEAVESAPKTYEELETVTRLNAQSEYTGRDNRVIIYGAQSDNYRFLYSYTNQEGVTVTQEQYGASVYNIERRPIVVEAITRSEPMVEIYADTHRIYTDNVALEMDEVELSLPHHTETTTTYYLPKASSSIPTNQDIGFGEGATAVVNGDDISFIYTATVVPTDGMNYARYIDFSHGYFNMNDVGTEGYKEYPVQVGNLQLAGDKRNNYTLVYKSSDKGVLETTNQTVTVQEGTFQPEIPAGHTYYAAGVRAEDGTYSMAMARVWLRPIAKISITTAGRTKYTYGETYDPSQSNRDSQDRQPMVIHIEYVNDEKNNYAGNPYIGEVQFRVAGTHDGEVYTTFDSRSLKIYYVKDGEKVEDVIVDEGRALTLQSALSVTEHHGARIVVTGQRGGQKERIVSELSEATLQIDPKTLTLRAIDKYRVYGENNPDFDFTFSAADLSPQDRVKLGSGDFEILSGEKLSQLGFAYTVPQYTTAATADSDVRNGGQAGYSIEVKPGGEGILENYDLEYEPATLYVYPRPVKIVSFSSSDTDPVYTIFSDVPERLFSTNVDQKRFQLTAHSSGGYLLENGTLLPVTGTALHTNAAGVQDEMVLRIEVQYPKDLKLDSAEAKGAIPVDIVDASIVAGTRAAGNYLLETARDSAVGKEVAVITNRDAVGTVELRNITTIEVTHWPNKMNYTYGEALDLSGLQVKIRYNTEGGSGTGQTTVVDYMGTDQFAQHGLYVNYYDFANLDPNDTWANIKEDYRTAASGDHLTIAYTHDSQLKGRRDWFAANGKYLIVSAQRHSAQAASRPIISGVPIVVDPLPITFTLSAEDKIYNGNTQAAGTITFTNIFNQSGYVDSQNSNGVTDLVYPVIGADYEEQWGGGYSRQENFRFFNAYVAQNGYTFTTGSYVPNDSSILTGNKTISWTPGYIYGSTDSYGGSTLTFSYLDPNVAYAQDPAHDYYGALATKDVQVTGLRLAGPDAANYTLVGQKAGATVEVTTNNVTQAQREENGYLGRGLPTATIHKANRAALTTELLPQVEIDPHTNVVRVVYDQGLSAITGGEEGVHLDELHYEFALQQLVTEEAQEPTEPVMPEVPENPEAPEEGTESLSGESGINVVNIVQWAGKDGQLTWADPRYFGGETAPKSDMPITSEDLEVGPFVPREEDIPKEDSITEDTTIKGQVYQWSALDDGFVLDPTAYPGGMIWPGYELYTTDRTALKRDQVYLAVVRAAETHNYNPSPALSSVEGYTPAMIQDILEAQDSLNAAITDAAIAAAQQRLNAALQAAGEPLSMAVQTARQDAQAEVDALMSAGENNSKLEERPTRQATSAVKTYKQVIETVSVKEMQSAEEESRTEPYRVPTLEDIWFTDVEELSSKEVLDAVVWNMDPVRYRRYAWDDDFTAELTFDKEEEPISLREPFEVTVTAKGENGSADSEELIRVNEDHNARLYADITFPSSSGNVKPELIVIRPGSIMAALGDPAVELEISLYPQWAKTNTILWASSDPEVATVDDQGRVIFVGVGTAVITATVPGNYAGAPPACSASITVTVVEDWKKEYPNSIFDFGNLDAFLVSGDTDGQSDRLFLPENGITRGEVARLLVQFYVENPAWSKSGPEDFADLTGEEDYAEAARMLGKLGVFLGYPEGGFNGEQYISRAEFVTLLARMTGLDIVDTAGQPHAFRDTGEEDTWAYAEIDALSTQTTGVLLGVGEGYFAPDRNITRSEVAALLTRLLRFPMTENGELVVPVDVTEDHWARECILRAVNGSQILEESMVLEVQ